MKASKTQQRSSYSKTQAFIFQFTNAGSHHQHSGTVKKIQLFMYIEKGWLRWAYKNNYNNSNDAESLIGGGKGTTGRWEDTGESVSWQVGINNCSPTEGPSRAEPGPGTTALSVHAPCGTTHCTELQSELRHSQQVQLDLLPSTQPLVSVHFYESQPAAEIVNHSQSLVFVKVNISMQNKVLHLKTWSSSCS